MNSIKHFITIATAGIALLSSGFSTAQTDVSSEPTKTRAQVRAEVLAAQRDGELPYSDWAISDKVKSQKTRAQVRAEVLAAKRNGEVLSTEYDLDRAARNDFKSEKTRAQVRAETLEARRLGLMPQGDHVEPVIISSAQAELIRLAGLRVIRATNVAAAR